MGEAERERVRSPLPSGLTLVTAAGSLCCGLTRTVIFIFTARFPCRSLEKAEESHPFPRVGYTLALQICMLCRLFWSSEESTPACRAGRLSYRRPNHGPQILACKELAAESSKLISSGWEGGEEPGS